MGVLVDGSIFGPRVKFSKGIINTKEGFKYFPDYIDSTINGVFTDKAGIESGKNIDRGSGIILNSSYKGTVTIQRESNTGQDNLYTKKLFGDIELINESGGFDSAVFKFEDMKYLYEHGELPLTDDSRLFLRLGDLEYRISTVRKMLNVYDKDGNDIGEYSPDLSVCYNGQIIQRYNVFNIGMSIDNGGSIKLAGSDIAMIVLRIKNIDPTVVLQRKIAYGMEYYDATLNGYVNTSGEKSQSPSSFIYIPVFVQANTYTSTSSTKFLIKGSGSNWYEANSDIKIKPIHQLVEKMQDEFTRTLFDTYGFVNEPSVTTNLSDYNSAAEPYISNPVSFRPAGGVHFAWTYNPVNNIDTDDIIYNSLNARTSDPPAPEPGEDTPADDPDTDFTPVVPGDVLPGYEVWTYPSTEFINGIPGDIDSWDPLYSSFIFKSYYKSNTGVYQPDSAWEFINDCNNVSISEPFHTLFKIATGHPTLQELISRIYELPFDYDQIFTEPDVMLAKSTISYGFIGPITVDFFNNGDADTTKVHYFNRTTRKFYRLNLGSLQLQKVFNNYLDYTDTVYKLNLPYGAGTVELDPNLLFDNERVTAIIDIKGYLDIDTGFLVIKVLLNNQLYYETSVNVSVDMIANSTNAMAVPVTLAKMFGGMALGGGIISSALKRESSRANEMSLIDIKHKNQLELMNERRARDAANAEYTRENDERRIQGYKDLYIYKTKASMFKDAYKSYMKGKGDDK